MCTGVGRLDDGGGGPVADPVGSGSQSGERVFANGGFRVAGGLGTSTVPHESPVIYARTYVRTYVLKHRAAKYVRCVRSAYVRTYVRTYVRAYVCEGTLGLGIKESNGLCICEELLRRRLAAWWRRLLCTWRPTAWVVLDSGCLRGGSRSSTCWLPRRSEEYHLHGVRFLTCAKQ